jgi:predicted TIM-barrel fold metal-dependent hydrolase
MRPRTDVHQHLWSEPLVAALQARRELPFVRREHGLSVLYLAGERPYVIDLASERAQRRAAQVREDGLERALVCLSSPLGIESLPRGQAAPLLDAYHDGALRLGAPFGVWGSIALDPADPDDVDAVLARGCVGLSLPAGALASVDRLARLHEVLVRLERADAPLFVHPGPGPRSVAARVASIGEASLADPLWWAALTRYVSDMHAAWLAFLSAGRAEHPRLRIIFSMLAGLAPLHAERLCSRGGPGSTEVDPLIFYETSSYGPAAATQIAEVVGAQQLLYGSDRPVADPREHAILDAFDWNDVEQATSRALGERRASVEAATAEAAAAEAAAAAAPAGRAAVQAAPFVAAEGPAR